MKTAHSVIVMTHITDTIINKNAIQGMGGI
jgi:hypothetical protein